MIDGKRVLAVVPARGGSKGIPLKNLRTIAGRSLVAIAGEVARQVSEIDRAVVSTDHEAIAAAAAEAGLDASFRRPPELSGDRIGDWDVLNHALLASEAMDGVVYDIVVMLQPTSPLRRVSDVSATIRRLVEGNYDAVWSVSESDPKAHPFKQLVIADGALDYWDLRGASIVARQQLTSVYHRNGVAYAVARACLVEQKTIKGNKTGAHIVEGPHISIDTEWDIDLVEFALSKGLGSLP